MGRREGNLDKIRGGPVVLGSLWMEESVEVERETERRKSGKTRARHALMAGPGDKMMTTIIGVFVATPRYTRVFCGAKKRNIGVIYAHRSPRLDRSLDLAVFFSADHGLTPVRRVDGALRR